VEKILIDLQYLPPISYFSALATSSLVVLEKNEHFVKQTFRNRCIINTPGGVAKLIVPVVATHAKTKVSEIKIDYQQKWLNNHWRAIQSAYGKAPFFEYYQEDLHRILFKRFELLYDLNFELLTMCLKMLKSNLTMEESTAYNQNPTNDLIDLRSAINPKKSENFPRFYRPVPYYQVFGNKFVENLSIIDLIFCEGPGAASVVQASSPN
jgi:hypothetical protein